MTRTLRPAVLAVVLGACGSDSASAPEIVVADATLDGAAPRLIGATATTVFWSGASGSSTLVAGASLASLPAQASQQLASGVGPVAHAGDHVVFVTDRAIISRVDSTGAIEPVASGTPEALAGSAAAVPVVAWSAGPVVSWGATDAQMTATLTKIDDCDHALVTAQQIYVACDGTSGRRLLRIDQRTGDVTPITAASTWAPMFPGGGMAGATYSGRIVGGDDDGALWLVEEMPSRRGILVLEPVVGEPSVLLEHIARASGFFASADTLYWQESDALLSAPRAGGAASIVAAQIGTTGAFADGYVYFTNGTAIERLRVE